MLLKNLKQTLPLAAGKKSIAIIGPHANASKTLVGNYLGELCPGGDRDYSCVASLYDGIQRGNKGSKTTMALTGLTTDSKSEVQAALAAASAADVLVLAMGIDQAIEGESHDRTDIDLPANQHELIGQLAALGKPIVLLLFNGGMVAVEAEKAVSDLPFNI